VSKDVVIGEGSIILEYATIGPGAEVGAFCLIQIASIIAHGNKVGDFSRIDCHVVCVGNVQIGNRVTIHTSAVINHGVIVGDGSVVGALSFVVRKVKPCTTVWGNPAKTLKF
jgi:acetyltransferase-like isoleucine patch superfamily enzyme